MTINTLTSTPIQLILKPTPDSIGTLDIEAIISENYTCSATATKFPLENGSIVSDHVVNEPRKIKLEGFISNTPLDADPDNYAQSAYNELMTMYQTKQFVTVVSGFEIFQNMVITSLTIPRTVQTGQAIYFTAEMTQIMVVGDSASNSDVFKAAVVDQASPTIALGQQVVKPIPASLVSLVTKGATFVVDYFGKLL